MKSIKYWWWLGLVLPVTANAWQWMDLWQTPDQQGSALLQAGKPQAAAQLFKDKNWQNVAQYRSGNYEQAYQQFSGKQASDDQYNAGNAAAFMGKYQEAMTAYDKAIAMNSANADAVFNRDIVKKLLAQQQQQQQPQNQQQKNNASSEQNKDKQNNAASQKNSQSSSQESSKNKDDPAQQPKGTQPSQYNKMTKAEQASAAVQQRQNEKNQQLLRRLTDEPGSLLQQKFLRDYYRRHGGEEN